MNLPINSAQSSKLKIFRELNNYTQKYIAEEILQISQNTYSRLESNPSKITKQQAEKLAKLYNLSIEQLLSNDSPIVSFSNNTIDKAFIQNYYETQRDLLDSIIEEKDKQIDFLKNELAIVRSQLSKLLEKVADKL